MIIFSIIGALVGAGFASGQEIYIFFYQFGIMGIVGLIFCSILIGLIIYKTFMIIYNSRISKNPIINYKKFLDKIFNINTNKRKLKFLNLSLIFNTIVNIFLLITFYIMISGFGAYFEQEFHISSIIGSVILAIITFFILLKNVAGVAKVNSIIVPVLITVICIISLKNMNKTDFNNLNLVQNNKWFLQSIVYCSYNMILVIPVLVTLSKYIKSKKQIIDVSLISSGIVFLLAISVFLLLNNVDRNIEGLEMPVVYVVDRFFSEFRLIYGIAILLSIFSTAISIGISFIKNIAIQDKSFPHIAGIMCISSVIISKIGFSNLIKFIFPVFGYLGIIQIAIILIHKSSLKID